MELTFSKMHGLGNDFVVIDAISQPVSLSAAQIRALADRHLGVGCDQVLLVEAPDSDDVDFCYRIFNQDGGEVEQCGNGVRCFARFVVEKGLTTKREIAVKTAAGTIYPRLEADDQVTVNMGVPRFAPEALPFVADVESDRYTLAINPLDVGDIVEIGAVSMGNPHAVLAVEDLDKAPVATLGPLIEAHERFPQRVNAGFVELVDRSHIKLRVFERGVGETQACGTGACAAVAVTRRWGWVDEAVTVSLLGGDLLIRWAGKHEPVWMTGPAVTVFDGTIPLDRLGP
jgi:diaminopimelate epimerase